MTKSKKLASFIVSTVLALSMTATASFGVLAEETATTTSISISTSDTHTYVVYQIFTGTVSSDGTTISDVEFGGGVDSSALLNALGLSETATATDAAEAMSDLSASEIAEILAKDGVLATSSGTLSSNNTSLTVAEGYYYAKETDTSTSSTGDILLYVDGEETISPKLGTPSVEKKIQEDDRTISSTGETIGTDAASDGWNDAADYSIGDTVPFVIYGSMPDNIDSYDHYYYKFTDTLGAGFVAPDERDITVYVDNYDVTSQAAITITANDDGSTTITIEFKDIKALTDTNSDPISIDASTIVKVSYSAVLDTDAVIGEDGNINGVYLTYSTDTSYDGNGVEEDDDDDDGDSTSDSEWDGVVAFTYTLDNTKVDEDGETLTGAEFVLYYLDGETKYYVVVEDNIVTSWTTNIDEATVLGKDGSFEIKGLDSGTYYISETKAPDGYNSLTGDIEVVITADGYETVTTTYIGINNTGDWEYNADTGKEAYGTVTATYTLADDTIDVTEETSGTFSASIVNSKGSVLPTTGGIGTTIFYVAGGVLVAGAAVLLVTRRRMKNQEG